MEQPSAKQGTVRGKRAIRGCASMTQHMSQHLSLGLRQEQRLTPQLIQSMNVLQLPLLALEAHVREELERNPALEIDDLDSTPPETAEAPPPTDGDDLPQTADTGVDTESLHEAEGFSRLERLSREYDFDEGDRSFGRRMRETGEPIDVSLSAGDVASLLVDWINELIGHSEIAGAPYLCTRLRLETSDGGVACRATVAPVATRWRSYLKAATLHDLRFEKRGARWFAQVVCDL